MSFNFYTLTAVYLGTFALIIGVAWLVAGHFDKKASAEKKEKHA